MDATSFELSASSRTLFEPTQASATTGHFQTPSALPVSPQTLFEHTQASATSGCSQTPLEPSASSTNYPHHPQTLTESSATPYTPSYSQHCHSVFMSGCASPRFSMVQSPMNFYGPCHNPSFSSCYQQVSNKASTPYTQCYQPTLPFTLCFITGNIRVCIGCRNNYPKSPKPPHDLCIRHEEWRHFTSPSTSKPQTKFGNVYYHCRTFTSSELYVPPDLQLSPVHKDFLLSAFEISL